VVRQTAARVATALCFAASALQFARGQSLERLSVESFNLNADTTSPKIDVPFHLTVTLRVRERIGEIENLNLPILAELDLLGDERQTTGGPHGTLYRETIAVVAHNPGPIAIAPATLQAIDARDGKPKEWYTNGLTLRVTGSISPALNTGGQVVLAVVLRALHFLLWLLLFALGVGCVALIVLLLFVRGRTKLPAAVPEQPAPAESIPDRSPRQQAQDALAVLRAQRSRPAAVAVRAAIWRTIGASDGETLADVLRRPQAQEMTMRQLLIALERSAFTYESDLDAALDDACSALERYIGSAA
jgi:hypothetical protein